MKSKPSEIVNLLPTSMPKQGPLALKESVDMIFRAHHEFKMTREVERTKRKAISDWKEVQLKNLSDRRELLEMYLTQQFAERRYLITELFNRLDQGIEKGDDMIIKASLDGIVEIARQSPLANASQLLADMSNPDIKCIDI